MIRIRRTISNALTLMTATVIALAAQPAQAVEYDNFMPAPALVPFASPTGDLSDEPSGLAASRTNPGSVLWVNEAIRDGWGMLYAVDGAGFTKAFRFAPTGFDRPLGGMEDFEDMAIGPCDGALSPSCVWVGDIGRVSADFPAADKNMFWLQRMAEPDIAATPDGAELPVTGRFPFTVPAEVAAEGLSSFDMETLLVHPQTGEVFLVTKGRNSGGVVRVMRYPGPFTPGVPKELEIVATIAMPNSFDFNPLTLWGLGDHLVTGGDIHPDGRRFVLRTYGKLWEFRGVDFATALAAPPVELPLPSGAIELQGEAVAYGPDGSNYYTLGEYSKTLTRYLSVFTAVPPPAIMAG